MSSRSENSNSAGRSESISVQSPPRSTTSSPLWAHRERLRRGLQDHVEIGRLDFLDVPLGPVQGFDVGVMAQHVHIGHVARGDIAAEGVRVAARRIHRPRTPSAPWKAIRRRQVRVVSGINRSPDLRLLKPRSTLLPPGVVGDRSAAPSDYRVYRHGGCVVDLLHPVVKYEAAPRPCTMWPAHAPRVSSSRRRRTRSGKLLMLGNFHVQSAGASGPPRHG